MDDNTDVIRVLEGRCRAIERCIIEMLLRRDVFRNVALARKRIVP
jgi:hypothetical protein